VAEEKMEELANSWLLDGSGGGHRLTWDQVENQNTDDNPLLWLHLNYSQPEVQTWMYERSGLSPLTVEALLQIETRPRCVVVDGGLMLFLRGVNLNPGADPEDMVSLRLWVGEKRVYTLGLRKLLSLDDMRESLSQGSGPESTGDFIVQLVELLLDRAGVVIEDLYDLVDQLEETVLVASSHQQREQLAVIRRQAISLRRFLAPQREALNRLASERAAVFNAEHHLRMREAYDRLTRFVEDLDAARERAGVVHESLISSLAEQTNARMYVLAIISAIFLPLSFITGLLGINVGGIPGAESPFGFVVVIAAIVAMGGVLWAFFRWRHWF
jgi:zinc transporter